MPGQLGSSALSLTAFYFFLAQSLGAADYITLASTYHTLAITDIPVLTLASKDRARRFITLIDALYERRCRLICTADADPTELFFPLGSSSAHASGGLDALAAEAFTEGEISYRPNVSAYDRSQASDADSEVRNDRIKTSLNDLSIFSGMYFKSTYRISGIYNLLLPGHDEQFAYKRALSRLLEMTSGSYMAAADQWSPLPSEQRQWEHAAPMPQHTRVTPTPTPLRFSGSSTEEEDDFALEASYDSPVPLAKRPQAPKIRPEHVWGVRDDWGQKAKAWGRGASHKPNDGR